LRIKFIFLCIFFLHKKKLGNYEKLDDKEIGIVKMENAINKNFILRINQILLNVFNFFTLL
jgi:hypothetical protein